MGAPLNGTLNVHVINRNVHGFVLSPLQKFLRPGIVRNYSQRNSTRWAQESPRQSYSHTSGTEDGTDTTSQTSSHPKREMVPSLVSPVRLRTDGRETHTLPFPSIEKRSLFPNRVDGGRMGREGSSTPDPTPPENCPTTPKDGTDLGLSLLGPSGVIWTTKTVDRIR